MTHKKTPSTHINASKAAIEDFSPHAVAAKKLDGYVNEHPSLKPLVAMLHVAVRGRNEDEIDVARSALVDGLKSVGATDIERLEMVSAACTEGERSRQTHINRVLLKQVAERHEGR